MFNTIAGMDFIASHIELYLKIFFTKQARKISKGKLCQ